MATERNLAQSAARWAARRRAAADEPASVLAARQLADEAADGLGRRRAVRRHVAVPIRPLTDILRPAS